MEEKKEQKVKNKEKTRKRRHRLSCKIKMQYKSISK